MEFKVIAERTKSLVWIVLAITSFLVTLTFQTIYRSNAWPFDYLKALPPALGDIVAMIFWIGAGPLFIAFLFLIPIASIRTTVRLAMHLTTFICFFNPISNYYFNLVKSGEGLQYKTLILNFISLAVLSIPLFLVTVIFPKIIFHFLSRKN